MKTLTMITTAAALLLATQTVWAQPGRQSNRDSRPDMAQRRAECTRMGMTESECPLMKRDGTGPRDGFKGKMFKDRGPGNFHHHLMGQLDLRPDQKQRLLEHRKTKLETRQEHREERRSLELALRNAMLARPTQTAQIEEIKQQLLAMEGVRIQARIDQMLFLLSILDETQFNKLKDILPTEMPPYGPGE